MEVTRYKDAKEYYPPSHHGCAALRLQGFDASGADFAWTGISHILPGGGADMEAGPLGKIYIVLAGEVTVTLDGGVAETLGVMDSCFIPAGEAREVRNPGNSVASMIVVMPYPENSQ